MSKIKIGQSGEKLAGDFLKKQGFKILETNFKSKFGEIDIIALEKDILVFVEVKTRTSRAFGLPEEAINKRKIDHIVRASRYYRTVRKNLPQSERIDVVALEMGDNPRIELFRNITV